MVKYQQFNDDIAQMELGNALAAETGQGAGRVGTGSFLAPFCFFREIQHFADFYILQLDRYVQPKREFHIPFQLSYYKQ